MTTQTNMRLDDDTRTKIDWLSVCWGPVKPLTVADVVRECMRRVHQSETKTKEKR